MHTKGIPAHDTVNQFPTSRLGRRRGDSRLGVLSACGTKNETMEKPAESMTPSPSATAPAPTEKAVAPSPTPNNGENSFAPSVKATPAPTLPGNVITGG